MENQPERIFLFWSRSAGRFGKLNSLLTDSGWTVLILNDAASLSHIDTSAGKSCCLALLDPRDDLSPNELDSIKGFLSRGGAGLVATGANGQDDSSASTNINELTRHYGVEFNEDCVIRPNPYKLYHPKEAMLEEFTANRGLDEVLQRHIGHKPSEDCLSRPQGGPVKFGPRIIYARGCTLKVRNGAEWKPIVVMTSSRWTLPGGQAICTFHRDDKSNSNVIVLGSACVLSDEYLDREDNRSLLLCFLDFLTSTHERRFPINISDARTLEIAESNMTADLGKLLEEPVGCLSELEPLPENKWDLLDLTLFTFDNSKLPLVIEAYQELGLDYEPLTLMRGHLEWPESFMAHRPKFLLRDPKAWPATTTSTTNDMEEVPGG